ncbi:MAG: cytidine deaminase [Eubacterium sp.]|nr:cytidine deaminase [Eubacterium sp.]
MNNNLSESTIIELINSAISARENAYAIYSHFKVGAAVLSDDGRIFTGCNVENASYPAGSCAETVAVNKAVSEGARKLQAIAIVGGLSSKDSSHPNTHDELSDYTFPCGICRQVLIEFKASDGLLVIVAKNENDYKLYDISELLPGAFSKDMLQNQ